MEGAVVQDGDPQPEAPWLVISLTNQGSGPRMSELENWREIKLAIPGVSPGATGSFNRVWGALTAGDRTFRGNAEYLRRNVVGLPVLEWNYISDTNDTPHLGPMAEDFYAAFGLGADAQHIAPGDLAGVVLAGVQGLVDVIEQQNAQIDQVASVLGAESSLPQQASRGTAEIVAWLSDYYGTQIAELSGSSSVTGDGSASHSVTTPAPAATTSTSVPSATPGPATGWPADPAAGRRQRWRPASATCPSAPTLAARCASPPPAAG